ncbi:hypothetical protein [Acidovorax sp. RAC01]|uniref:hypothetical protein n=1 Tax=Acidovorax sp. RAC01 TaxID=1842533 RepID=UPI00083E91AE|nr:hypothetical protein [Acidovorax sp. RAC01]AOG23484.1 PGAP1-like family protein [Acidovorax sp. RAC01]
MTRQLVFVHGRAQERLDSIALKKEWISAWKTGLDKAGLAMPLDESDIRFPYYGDTLEQMTEGRTADEAARIVVRGEALDRTEEAFMRAWLQEMQTKAGISDAEVAAVVDPVVRERGVLNWGWVQGILQVLDTKVPGASGASVALATKDVYGYLTNQAIRDTMDAGVRSAFAASAETVVVSHSLGTVVAYNVLRRDSDTHGLDVPLFVTLGSPLAVTVVKKAIRPISHPSCAKHWFNAMDERDVVSLFPLDSDHFDVDPAIENKTDVNNPTENRHGISGYLGDPEVARRIHAALIA